MKFRYYIIIIKKYGYRDDNENIAEISALLLLISTTGFAVLTRYLHRNYLEYFDLYDIQPIWLLCDKLDHWMLALSTLSGRSKNIVEY